MVATSSIRVGRPSRYKAEFAKMARHLCKLGATDADLADAFEVSVVTIDNWKTRHPEFLGSLKSKEEADNCVERSLYARATGYTYDAVKIFHTKDGKIIKVPYTEHVPPDVTACIFWLKNRRPSEWRDVQAVDAAVGHYIISDRPMSEQEWIEAYTKVTPALPQPSVDDEKPGNRNGIEEGST
jgi:hypothetical protein